MAPVGFQEGTEKLWWWKVAFHLDEAQIALANATAHNVDDPRMQQTLYDRLREGQGVLLQILAAKGLIPRATNGVHNAPPPVMSEPAVPEQMILDAEIVDEPPTPSEDGHAEGHSAQATAETVPIVGYTVEATVEPAEQTAAEEPAAEKLAVEATEQTSKPGTDLVADPQPPVVANGQSQDATGARGDRAE